MKKLTLILMTLAAIFIFAGCSKSPKDAALAWGKATINGNLEEANKYSTSGSKEVNQYLILRSNSLSAEKKKERVDNLVKEIKNAKCEIDGDTAAILIESENMLIPIRKVDGEWKVDVSDF